MKLFDGLQHERINIKPDMSSCWWNSYLDHKVTTSGAGISSTRRYICFGEWNYVVVCKILPSLNVAMWIYHNIQFKVTFWWSISSRQNIETLQTLLFSLLSTPSVLYNTSFPPICNIFPITSRHNVMSCFYHRRTMWSHHRAGMWGAAGQESGGSRLRQGDSICPHWW